MKVLSSLNKYFWRYKWRFLLGIVFIAATNVLEVYSPLIIGDALDELELLAGSFSDTEDKSSLAQLITESALLYAGLYILIYIIKGVFLFFTRQTIIIMSRLIEFDIKNEIFNHYLKLDMGFYRKNNTGDIMNRISEDVTKVRMYLGPAVMYTINLIVLFILTIYIMFSINAELSLYVLLPLPLMSIGIYYVSNKINKKSEAVQRQQSKLSTIVQESFSGIRVLKSYAREGAYKDTFSEETDNYKEKSLSLIKTEALFFPIIFTLIGLSTILTIYIGGLKANAGEISNGEIVAFVIFVNKLTWPFASVGWVTSLVQRAAASQKRIIEFLHEEPEIKNPTDESFDFKGKIEFKNVSFKYPESGIQALKDISFTINPGETLAIIGKTGSGKSTIANLLTRQYDPTEGEILIDDKNMRDVNLKELRESIGYVPQDVFLFSDSIRSNIAFGNNIDASNNEQIEMAAKNAVVHDNIVAFRDKYDTVVGERGITLSGGQKQRISIARAIIKEPTILLFDDCLSAVDTETEERILSNLKNIMANKTSVIISHRVSTVKHADKIIVLKDGELEEKGDHDSLLKSNGVYAQLYKKQLLEQQTTP